MTPENIRHLRAVGRPPGGGIDYFSSFAEVRGPHDRRGYEGELFRILAAEVIETVHRPSWDAQRLPRTNLDGRPVNRPGKDTFDTVQDLLVRVVLVGRCRQLLPGGDENLEHRRAAVGIIGCDKEPDAQRTNLDGLFRRIDAGRTLLHIRAPVSVKSSDIFRFAPFAV